MSQQLQPLPAFQIPFLMEKASLFGGKVTQPSVASGLPGTIAQMTVHRDTFSIRLRSDVYIERERPLEVRLSYRSMSFQVEPKEFSIEGDLLIGRVPKVARALPIRDNERYAFPLTAEVHADIRRVEKRGCSLAGQVQMVDVSRKGLGILVVNGEIDGLLRNDHLWLRQIGGMSLEGPIFGTVVYSFEKRFKDSIDLKCGVSLETELPDQVFAELQRQCRLILPA